MSVAEHAVTPTRLVADIRFGAWSGFTPPTGYSDILSATPMTISVAEQETQTLVAANHSNLGQVLDSGTNPTGKAARLSLTAATMTPLMRALALGATVSEATQSAAAVVDESVTLALGAWTKIAHSDIEPHGTGTEIVLETAGTPDVAIASTKYEIDTAGGFIRPLHADAVGVKKLSYHTKAITWEKYAAGGTTSKYVHITGVAYDAASGFTAPIDIWRVMLAAKGEFDPTTNKFMAVVLEGDLVLPKNAAGEWITIAGRTPSSPWEFNRRTA